MADPRSHKAGWGVGRVAFVANLDTIRLELGQGLPLTAIYDRHKAALGIGYKGFCRLVARYADDAKPIRRRLANTSVGASPPTSAPTAKAPPSPSEARTHARYEPAARPDFRHHGIVQEGEPEQLFGPGFLSGRRG